MTVADNFKKLGQAQATDNPTATTEPQLYTQTELNKAIAEYYESLKVNYDTPEQNPITGEWSMVARCKNGQGLMLQISAGNSLSGQLGVIHDMLGLKTKGPNVPALESSVGTKLQEMSYEIVKRGILERRLGKVEDPEE